MTCGQGARKRIVCSLQLLVNQLLKLWLVGKNAHQLSVMELVIR